MSSRFLPVVIENASFVLNGTVPLLLSGRASMARVLAFCTQYRRRGIASLLLSGRATSLLRDLQRSGAAYAGVLERYLLRGNVLSKAAPLFDAIACCDWDSARRIVSASNMTWSADEEYEDDFLYVKFLVTKFLLPQPEADLQTVLHRYAELLDGDADPRYAVCDAFQRRDLADFEAALEIMIQRREDDYEQGIDADQIVEEEWSTEGKVFVEGLALVQLARRLGLAVQDSYLFIPAAVLDAPSVPSDPHAWARPDA